MRQQQYANTFLPFGLQYSPPIHVDYELRPIAHHRPGELAAAHHPPQLERHTRVGSLVQKVVCKFKDSVEEQTVTVSTRRSVAQVA